MQDSGLTFSSPISGMQIRSEVRVSKPVALNRKLLVRRHHVFALWDTGASISAISRSLADKLELKVYEHAVLSTAAGLMNAFRDIVLLDLLIDGSVIPVKAAIVDSIPGENNQFMIGMDVIQRGSFTIDTAPLEGNFNVSFKPYPGIFRPVEQFFLVDDKN